MKKLVSIMLMIFVYSTSALAGDFNWVDKKRQIKIFQRSSVVLDRFTSARYPEIKRTITLQLGDITRRQVMVRVSFKRDGDIVKTRSLSRGDVLRFRFQDTVYVLTLDNLINKVIKNDYAYFSVVKSRPVATRSLETSRF